MKILHTSDWHLGKIVMAQSMLEDQRYFIRHVFLKALDEFRPDVIVLAGDIYDRSIAPVSAIELFEETLYSVADRKIPFIAVSGNHDSPERLIPAARLLRSCDIYLANAIGQFFEPIDLTAADGSRARFFTLPYFDISMAKDFLQNDELKNVNDAYRLLVERAEAEGLFSADCPNILITHCTVMGNITTCESESAISVGGAQQVSSDIFGRFDYTCLGHIHSPQKAGGGARYCGSPLRYSFDPNERDKRMLLVDTENGMSVTEIPIKPRREMMTIRGTFEELCNVPDNCSEDYIFAIVDDDHFEPMPTERLREKYPFILNSVQLYMSSLSGSDSSGAREKIAGNKVSDEELVRLFLKNICDTEPTDEDIEFFNMIKEKLGDDVK